MANDRFRSPRISKPEPGTVECEFNRWCIPGLEIVMAKANEISFALKNCRGERSFALEIVRPYRFRSPKTVSFALIVRLNRSYWDKILLNS